MNFIQDNIIGIAKDTKNTIISYYILTLFETWHYVPIYRCPFMQLPIFRWHELKVGLWYPKRVPDLCHRFGNVCCSLAISLTVIADGEGQEETPDFIFWVRNLRIGRNVVSEGAAAMGTNLSPLWSYRGNCWASIGNNWVRLCAGLGVLILKNLQLNWVHFTSWSF